MPDALPTWDEAFGATVPPSVQPTGAQTGVANSSPAMDAYLKDHPVGQVQAAFGPNTPLSTIISPDATRALQAAGVHDDIAKNDAAYDKAFGDSMMRPAAAKVVSSAKPSWDEAFSLSQPFNLDRLSSFLGGLGPEIQAWAE